MSPAKLPLIFLLAIILLMAVMASGCTSAGSGTSPTAVPGTYQTGTQQASSPDTIVLTVNGSVSNPLQLTLSDLDTYPTIPVNMSTMMPGRSGNLSGNAGRSRPGGYNSTMPSGTGGDGQTGTGGYMPSGTSGNFPGGSMPGGYSGSMPSGTGGYYQRGSMPAGMDANASYMYGRGNSSVNVTGISLNSLLARANPSDNATTVTFLGTGGSTDVILLSEIQAHPEAAIVVLGQGRLEMIVPGTSAGNMVSGLNSIIVS